MDVLTKIFIGIVIAIHLYIFYFEMFAWNTIGKKAFGKKMPVEVFAHTKGLAANQGLYNLFLAAGLIWTFFIENWIWQKNIATFFSDLCCCCRFVRRHHRQQKDIHRTACSRRHRTHLPLVIIIFQLLPFVFFWVRPRRIEKSGFHRKMQPSGSGCSRLRFASVFRFTSYCFFQSHPSYPSHKPFIHIKTCQFSFLTSENSRILAR